MKTAESWKARQQQQYRQKSQEDVRREARTAPVFGDLVTYSKGVLGVFDSGVAPDFHVELVRFSLAVFPHSFRLVVHHFS